MAQAVCSSRGGQALLDLFVVGFFNRRPLGFSNMNDNEEKKRKCEDPQPSTAEVMDSLRADLFLRFDAITAKLVEHDQHRTETNAQLRELTAKTESATTAATRALEEVMNLKQEIAMASKPTSEASTASGGLRRPAFTTPRARAAPSSPMTATPLPPPGADGPQRAPDDDGRTLLLGGFPRDTPEAEMTTWLNDNIIGIHDIATKKPKYSKGSVALLSFNNPSSLWKVLKNPPILEYGDSRIWLTIPKTIEARARASALSTMRKALDEHKPIDANITILYTHGYLKCGDYIVGRVNPLDHGHIELSVAQLTLAGFVTSRENIMKTFTNFRKTTMLGVRDVSDWS